MATKIARHAGTAAALGFMLLAVCLALAFSGCAAQKKLPQYSEAERQAQHESISYWRPDPADTAHPTPPWAITPHAEPRMKPNLLSRVKQLFAPATAPVKEDSIHLNLVMNKVAVPGKCKQCPITVNYVQGNQTNNSTTTGKKGRTVVGDGASNTEQGRKSGDNIKADSGAHVNKVAGPGNVQTTHGNNNAPQLTAPVQQAADWRAVLAKPIGAVLAGVGTVVLVGGVIFLLAAYKRRQKLQA